jgi:hypothetical protein
MVHLTSSKSLPADLARPAVLRNHAERIIGVDRLAVAVVAEWLDDIFRRPMCGPVIGYGGTFIAPVNGTSVLLLARAKARAGSETVRALRATQRDLHTFLLTALNAALQEGYRLDGIDRVDVDPVIRPREYGGASVRAPSLAEESVHQGCTS